MRVIFGLLMSLMLLMPAATRAQDADVAAARDVIALQIDAFQRDDFEAAFTHASPMIQSMFGTPDRFAAMVRGGYPMVWRPSSIRFGISRENNGSVFQQVLLGGPRGQDYLAEYELIRIGGIWRIHGVQLLPDVGAGA